MRGELETLLERLGRRGAMLHAFRVDRHGPDIDIITPSQVYWSYAAGPVWTLRAFLTLAPPGHPDAPNDLIQAQPGLGLPAHAGTHTPTRNTRALHVVSSAQRGRAP